MRFVICYIHLRSLRCKVHTDHSGDGRSPRTAIGKRSFGWDDTTSRGRADRAKLELQFGTTDLSRLTAIHFEETMTDKTETAPNGGIRPHKRDAATTPFRGLIVSAPLETSPPTERSRPARSANPRAAPITAATSLSTARSNGNAECFQSRTCSAVPARRFRRCAGTLARVRGPGTVEAQRGSRASSGEAGGTKWLTK
jgi:hypothetical protein